MLERFWLHYIFPWSTSLATLGARGSQWWHLHTTKLRTCHLRWRVTRDIETRLSTICLTLSVLVLPYSTTSKALVCLSLGHTTFPLLDDHLMDEPLRICMATGLAASVLRLLSSIRSYALVALKRPCGDIGCRLRYACSKCSSALLKFLGGHQGSGSRDVVVIHSRSGTLHVLALIFAHVPTPHRMNMIWKLIVHVRRAQEAWTYVYFIGYPFSLTVGNQKNTLVRVVLQTVRLLRATPCSCKRGTKVTRLRLGTV